MSLFDCKNRRPLTGHEVLSALDQPRLELSLRDNKLMQHGEFRAQFDTRTQQAFFLEMESCCVRVEILPLKKEVCENRGTYQTDEADDPNDLASHY